MKLRYILTSLVAAIAVLSSCEKQEIKTQLDEVQVSKSYVAISMAGGSSEITLNAIGSWQIAGIPEWLEVTPTSGSAAKDQKVTFTATSTVDGRVADLTIVCEGKTQYVNVRQGVPGITKATCGEVIKGVEGKTYLVTGTCTKITGDYYGNFYLNDGTGELYIYGTVNDKGDYDWKNFNIEVGDEVTVQGARKTFNTTIEFEDALFVSVNKSLIKVATPETAPVVPTAGGSLEVVLENKGNNLGVVIEDKAKSWIGVSSLDAKANKVVFTVAPNEGAKRTTTVVFKTTDGKKDYTTELKITQESVPVQSPYAISLKYEKGANAYDDILATVNGYSDLKTLKIGTSSKVGDFTITVPAGKKKLVFNAVAWKNNTAVITLKAGDKELGKIEKVAGNDGATGNGPFVITVENNADVYTFEYNFAAETKVNVSADKRVVFYGIKAE